MVDELHASPNSRVTAASSGTRPPMASLVIATYNRVASAERLLRQLAEQTIAPDAFEVIVVDDGSSTPVAPVLASLSTPFELRVLTQTNAGQAAARHRAILQARADVIVVLDDDMHVAPTFLAEHLAAHPVGSHRLVLGRLLTHPGEPLPLYERMGMKLLDNLTEGVASGRVKAWGGDVYTGNVSFRREDYLAAGGFDSTFRLSEDREFGIRIEQTGVEIHLSPLAVAWHDSDHTSLAAWMRRAFAYGAADSRVFEKHPTVRRADPWRFLFEVNPVSRPVFLASALAPRLSLPLAHVAVRVALLAGRLGAERVALAGATFVYGLRYFAGLGAHAGTRRATLGGLARHLNGCRGVDEEQLGVVARGAKLVADVRADHRAILRTDAKYKGSVRRASLVADLIQKIGFQMMAVYRVMRFFRGAHLGILAKLTSRFMRILYSAEIHWDADLAPGVMIIHGTGLVVSHAARVESGCILFQHVTLGESIDAETRMSGAPALESDVHVGPGATLLGPITIGRSSKIMALALVMRSVPPHSLVETPAPVVRPRQRGSGRNAAPVLSPLGAAPPRPTSSSAPADKRRSDVV